MTVMRECVGYTPLGTLLLIKMQTNEVIRISAVKESVCKKGEARTRDAQKKIYCVIFCLNLKKICQCNEKQTCCLQRC